jgi:type I restriction enzyme S subunit
MTLDTFFEKFDQFADAPDAVAKMRELVLELAVQGKLVAPSPSPDKHPAWIAFRKELSERTYSYDPGPPPPFEIPDHWEWCVLDEVADCRAAAKVSPASIADTDWVLDLEDIDGTKGQIIQTATFAERRSLSTKAAFETGDVLYGKLRPYLNKVVVASKPGFCTTEIIPLRPAAFLSPEFLRYYLRSQTFLRYAAQKNYGMKMPRLGTKDLESAEIPIPPTSEQKRIVAKVDELMALCDRLEAQQQERDTQHADLARASLARFAEAPTPENLQFIFHKSYDIPPADLRKSILTLAVQGKLVPQDPKDEPADSILRDTQSLFDRLVAAKKLSAPKPLPPIKDDEVPFSLPIGWAWCRFGQIMRISSGDGLVAKDMNAGPIPVYGGNGVNGYHDEQNVWKQTLVIGRVGYYCGSIHVTPERAWVTDNAFTTTFDEEHIDMNFLSWLLKATDLRERDNATAQPVISGGKVYPTILALPPLAEQRRIVDKVDQLMALVDELETQLATSRATAANLLSALVGELTGTTPSGKVSASTSTGRRGRPKKS